MNTLRKKVTKTDFISEYIKIVNGVLQLSDREAEVFSFLLNIDFADKKENINSRDIRDNIMLKLGLSESNLSRHLGILKERGLLVRGAKGKWVINDVVRPVLKDGIFELKFVLDVDTTGNNNKGFSGEVS